MGSLYSNIILGFVIRPASKFTFFKLNTSNCEPSNNDDESVVSDSDMVSWTILSEVNCVPLSVWIRKLSGYNTCLDSIDITSREPVILASPTNGKGSEFIA